MEGSLRQRLPTSELAQCSIIEVVMVADSRRGSSIDPKPTVSTGESSKHPTDFHSWSAGRTERISFTVAELPDDFARAVS